MLMKKPFWCFAFASYIQCLFPTYSTINNYSIAFFRQKKTKTNLNYFSAPLVCLLRFPATGASTVTDARMTQQKIAETTFSSPASNESGPALDQVSLLIHFK
jgi:hypothetical protein